MNINLKKEMQERGITAEQYITVVMEAAIEIGASMLAAGSKKATYKATTREEDQATYKLSIKRVRQ